MREEEKIYLAERLASFGFTKEMIETLISLIENEEKKNERI